MNIYRVQLLAEQVLGLSPSQADEIIDNGEDYDTPLQQHLGIDFETFGKIANTLNPLSPTIEKKQIEKFIFAIDQFKSGKDITLQQEQLYK